MTPNQALAQVGPTEWSLMLDQAQVLLSTGFLPKAIQTPEQAVAIMLKGRELGIPPMYALSNIAVIQGKPTASAELMLALIYRDHGDNAIYNIRSDHEVAEYAYKRRSWSEYRRFSFTIEQARKAGITNNPNWTKYPAAMLRARCVSAIARIAFPDSIGGMYTPEEMGVEEEVTEDGEHRLVVVPEDMLPRIVEEPDPIPLSLAPESVRTTIQDVTRSRPSDDLPVEDEETTWPEPLAVHEAEWTANEGDVLELEDLFGAPQDQQKPVRPSPSPTEPAKAKKTGYTWQAFTQDAWDHMIEIGAAEKLRNTVIDLIYKDLEHEGVREDPTVLAQVLSEVNSWKKVQDVTLFANQLANKRREPTGHGPRVSR